MIEKFLKDKGCLERTINKNLLEIVDSIDSKLEQEQKLQLIVHYIMVFASQFRIFINHNSQNIPINAITFLFNYSGSGKDTTINIIKRIFDDSNFIIREKRNDYNNMQALEKYEDSPNKNAKLQDFYLNNPPQEIGISTQEGMLACLEDNSQFPLGAINVVSNEFMAEFARNPNMQPMMSSIAELYDLGNKNSKMIKNKDNRIGDIDSQALSCLFTSSFSTIEDVQLRNKLYGEFKSRFSRRSSITFNNNREKEQEITNLDEWLDVTINKKNKNNDMIEKYSLYFKELTKNILLASERELKLKEDAEKLLYIYRKYCEQNIEDIDELTNELTRLNIMNRWFKVLKLSGALAVFKHKFIIEEQDIVEAINITEIINEQISLFESELSKNEYEILIDYFDKTDKRSITIHELIKAGLIGKRTLKNDLENIVKLANSKHNKGIFYTNKENDMIKYQGTELSNKFGISYIDTKEVYNKKDRVKFMKQPMKYIEVDFERIKNMLTKNFIYCGFQFKNGIRNMENIIKKTNLLIFDIDKAEISMQEMSDCLNDIKHIVCSTSDKENIYKYRVIIPLDRYVEIENYKALMKLVAKDYLIGVNIDLLPEAQVFYSYKDSVVIENIDGELLNIKEYLLMVRNNQIKELTPKEKKEALEDSYNTFYRAYIAREGNRHKVLIWVIARAFYLNASYEFVIELINDINNGWLNKLDEKDMEGILKFANKVYKKGQRDVE
jgi:energy-coupling factor transporter ATP-binding protein EcfA2